MYNPGNDPVCSMCSVLWYTLMQMLLEQDHYHQVEIIKRLEQPGKAHVRFKVKPNNIGKAKTILRTVASGYGVLESQYPDNVKLKFYNRSVPKKEC